VMRRGDQSRAAIASRRAAEIYGGTILREHLEDDRENYTRFLLLAPEKKTSPGSHEGAGAADKLSLVFELAHLPGALYHSLAPFASRNINMMKIESRPMRGKPWQYRFHLDLQASMEDPRVSAAIAELHKLSAQFRILGSYKSAQTAQDNSVSSTEKTK
jgi:prephenate dehydratase